MIGLPLAPFPITWRELWLPPAINGNASLPTSVDGGHGLTLTGARKGTTVDGVHFYFNNGLSRIDIGALYNNATKWWISFRFKLDEDYAAGVPSDVYLFSKRLGAGDFIVFVLQTATGRLGFWHRNGGAYVFQLNSTQTSWEAGRWYHVLASIGQAIGGGAASNGARLRIDNGAAVTDPDVTPIFNGGTIAIGTWVGVATLGLQGVMSDVFMGTDDLTANEEADHKLFYRVACKQCGKIRWAFYQSGILPELCSKCKYKLIGKRINSSGYIVVHISKDSPYYPMARPLASGGKILEHRLAMAQYLGRCLKPWEVVHHKGVKFPVGSIENKQHNIIENLQLTSTQEHDQITLMERTIEKLERCIKGLEARILLLEAEKVLENTI